MFKNNLYLITAVAATGGLMFGFDMAVISGVLPLFTRQFHLAANQQGWFVSSALIGCVAGVVLSGELSERLGRRPSLVLSSLLFLVSTTGCVFGNSYLILIIFRVLSGLGVGIASNIVPLYLSEIAPSAKRGRTVTYYQLAITFGILVAYCSNGTILNYSSNHIGFVPRSIINYLFNKDIWRGMFLMGLIPSVLFFAGLFFIPESPRWLFNRGRKEEGANILYALGETSQTFDKVLPVDNEDNKKSSYKDLLLPVYRLPLIIGLLLPLFSQFCGINAIIYYGPTILHNAGLSLHNSLISQIIFGTANLLFTFLAIWLVDRQGRRKLYLGGSALAFFSLIGTGYCFYAALTTSIWLLLGVIIFVACFACSIGPLKFVIASEIFPGKIRGRALALSIMVMWISDTIVGLLTPVLLENFGNAFTFWFFSLFCLLAFLTVYFLLPETKGKSLEQIESFWTTSKVQTSLKNKTTSNA